jgi:hypothetical protein
MGTMAIQHSGRSAATLSLWPDAGRMCGASFMMRWNNPRAPRVGSCARSSIFTKSKRICGSFERGHSCAKPSAFTRAGLSWSVYITRALKLKKRFLPQSTMGATIDYTLSLWPALTVYLEDGRVEIDNNLVENAIGPTALGKKNWLFIGDARAGDRGAILYSIIESCRRRGVEPFTLPARCPYPLA